MRYIPGSVDIVGGKEGEEEGEELTWSGRATRRPRQTHSGWCHRRVSGRELWLSKIEILWRDLTIHRMDWYGKLIK